MATAVSPEILSRCGEFVARHLGLHFPESRRADLERGILSATVEFGFDDPQACMRWLMSAPLSQSQAEVLASHLTVGETYFFREKPVFDALEHKLLADLIASRGHGERRLRIWSAGCATGEEPYSVAILLKEMVPDLDRWNVTILGTDINARALGKAADGVYGEWSFRGMPAGLKEKYTCKEGGRYALRPDVARMVTFAYHNLVEDAYPSVANNTNAMDVILCCNVLMYFTREVAQRVVDGLRNALVDGGWLIVGASEGGMDLFPSFERVSFPGAVLFRRGAVPAGHPLPEATRWTPPVVAPAAQPVQEEAACDELETVIPAPLPPPTLEQALDFYRNARYAQAAELLRKLDEPGAFALLAKVYANQGVLQEALAWCEKAVAADRVDPRNHYLRATILQELGRIDEAVASLNHAVYLDPGFSLAHVALGHLLRKQGNQREANRHLRNALSLLRARPETELVPESEGVTAGRLKEAVLAMQPEGRT